ncbi:MAG: uncharacterized protein KVP18_003978 [Porospora cf. gigantea A]|uniref:uncharacterized protein n=1 Tax=Porospora cf. gigantea A TaxID=2853593 RepID=UPI0035594594|nr:MAG: hypothetical protein KVP18_003978 [Porospora cf. gigantea A]
MAKVDLSLIMLNELRLLKMLNELRLLRSDEKLRQDRQLPQESTEKADTAAAKHIALQKEKIEWNDWKLVLNILFDLQGGFSF